MRRDGLCRVRSMSNRGTANSGRTAKSTSLMLDTRSRHMHLDILGSRQVAAVRCTHSDQVVRSFASLSSVSPEEALAIAKDWPSFESMLKPIPLTCVGADGDR